MKYCVRGVDDRKTMKDFLRLPFEIYRDDANWIAPLTSEVQRVLDCRRNPYFESANVRLFVCYGSGRPLSRLAVVVNQKHWQKSGVKSAFFGFFESFNNPQAVQALFTSAEVHCHWEGAEFIEGPLNPNHYSELGFQSNKFGAAPAFFQSYNPAYYLQLMEDNRFEIAKRVHTRKNDSIREYILQKHGSEPSFMSPGVYTVRSFRMNDFGAELERIRGVFNDAFSDNWHFLPLTKEEYVFSAKFLNLVTYPDLITIVERNGEPVGVLECVLDINPLLKHLKGRVGPLKYLRYQRNRKNIRNLIVYAVGIKKSYQRTRVHRLLFDSLCQLAVKYDVLETTWMSDDNPLSVRAAEHFGLVPDKEFVIYRKRVNNAVNDNANKTP